jgi:hypothetical protein
MKSASFLASNVVIVRNDKVMFRSLMSNYAHIAQEMWEVLFELYPVVIKNGDDTSEISPTSLRKLDFSIHHFFNSQMLNDIE